MAKDTIDKNGSAPNKKSRTGRFCNCLIFLAFLNSRHVPFSFCQNGNLYINQTFSFLFLINDFTMLKKSIVLFKNRQTQRYPSSMPAFVPLPVPFHELRAAVHSLSLIHIFYRFLCQYPNLYGATDRAAAGARLRSKSDE